MKHLLFISQSRLSHNLLRTILPLVPVRVDLTCLENIDEINTMPRRGKPYSLILFDWNALSELKDVGGKLDELNSHPLLKRGESILIHTHGVDYKDPLLSKKGFKGFYAKPFLAEELASIIEKHMKG